MEPGEGKAGDGGRGSNRSNQSFVISRINPYLYSLNRHLECHLPSSILGRASSATLANTCNPASCQSISETAFQAIFRRNRPPGCSGGAGLVAACARMPPLSISHPSTPGPHLCTALRTTLTLPCPVLRSAPPPSIGIPHTPPPGLPVDSPEVRSQFEPPQEWPAPLVGAT